MARVIVVPPAAPYPRAVAAPVLDAEIQPGFGGDRVWDFVVGVLDRAGYVGIFLLMFLENVFPPIPSELVMPMAGYHAASRDRSLVFTVLSGTAGSLAGAGFWYAVGRAVGRDGLAQFAARHGRWLTLNPAGVERAFDRFDRHAGAAVFWARLVPALRTLISAPAGAAHMPLATFVVYSALGTTLWSTALTVAGFVLRTRFEAVETVLNPISTVIVVGLVGWYLYRVVRFDPAYRGSHARADWSDRDQRSRP